MRRAGWLAPRRALCALSLAMTCAGTARARPPTDSTIDLQVSVESGDYLAPDYVSIPVYVRITNRGPDVAEGVTVAIELPSFLSGQPRGDEPSCVTSGSSIDCTLLPLEAGAGAVVTVELFLPPEPLGEFEIRAIATGRGVELTPEDNQATHSTRGPGRLRLTGGSCSSVPGDGVAMGALSLLLLSRRVKAIPAPSAGGSRRKRK